MSHTSREKLDLVTRTRKIRGQLDSVERALEEDAACVDVLQRLSAVRGAINSLMAELMEDHILHHMTGKKTRPAEDAAADLIEIVRSYLK
jgi:DNA-binding FrmR family transcriptional regulator